MPDQYIAQFRVGLGQPGPSTSTAAKRPFQDLDTGGEATQDSSPGRSSASGSNPNKRARSEGPPSTDVGGSGSSNTLTSSSSSSGNIPIHPSAEFDVVPAETIPDPRSPPPTLPSPTHLLNTSSHLPMPTRSPFVDIHHLPALPASHPSTSAQPTLSHPPMSSTSTNSFEATLQRAQDFELQIAAIREDIGTPGASSAEHFPPTEPPHHSHSPLVSRASHDSDLPSVEQFLNDIRSRSPPLSSGTMQALTARRERLLSALSLLRRERRERQTGEREETSRTRSPSAHGLYLPDVPLQLYEHILSDHIASAIGGDYYPLYIGQTDSELAPLPLGLERELAEGAFHTAAIIRNQHLFAAREEFRTGRPRAWTTQSNPRTLFPHRSSRLDEDAPSAHSTWTSSTRIPSTLSTSEAENRLGRRRVSEFVEDFESEPWIPTRWPVDIETGGPWNDRPTQRHDHGWLPDRDRTRERDEELRHRALARINEPTSLLRLPPSSPPPASYWYGGHHDTTYIPPSTQSMVDNLLERSPDAPSRLDGPNSLSSILQNERRARRLPDRYASGPVHSSRDRELRERDSQSAPSSVLPPFTDFRTRSGFTPNMGQNMTAPYLRMLRSDHSSRPTIFRPPSPHLAPSRASPPPQVPHSTAGRTEASSTVGPSPPSPNPADSTSVFRNIDLSAYTGGPFRASLSTFREMNLRRERGETRTQRYWDHELDRERDREIERELDLERELERERERQREQLMREGSMLQSILSRRRSIGTHARTEGPETFATMPLTDPDSMLRQIVSSLFIRFFEWRTNLVVSQMEPPIRPPPRALDSIIHPSFPLPSPQSSHLPPATPSGVERRDTAPWNVPPFELNRTPSFHQRRRLPVPLPIQRQREAEEFNSRVHTDHLRSRTSSPWSTYESSSYDEVRGQRELGRNRRELHDLLTRRTRIEVARRLSEEARVPGSSSISSTTTAIPPPDIPSWTPSLEIIGLEYPIFEEPGSRFGGLERAEVSGPSPPPMGTLSTQPVPTAISNSEQPTSTSGLPRGMLRGSRLHPNRDLNATNTSILGPGLRRRTPPTSRSPTRGNTPGNVGSSTPAETSGPVNSANTRSATRVTRRAGRHRYISDYSGYPGFPFDIFDAPGSRRHTNRLRNMGDYIVSSLFSFTSSFTCHGRSSTHCTA